MNAAARSFSPTRDGSAEIAGKVDNLRATLVRVVRTSTDDVNRRTATRVDVNRQGTVEIGGVAHRALVRNLSESGAVLVDAIPRVAVGSAAVVTLEGLASGLAGVVARSDASGVLLNLELTGAARNLVEALIHGRHAA